MGRIEDLGDQFAADMPTPQESTIAAEAENATSELNFDDTTPRDSMGRVFDPAIHSVDADGNPRLTRGGNLRVKRGSGNRTSYIGQPAPTRQDALQAGTAIAGSIFGCCHMAFGDEWAPRVDPATGANERAAMAVAWGQYLEARGMTDIPPEILVAMVCATYALPRLVMPQTQTRMQRIGGWLKVRYLAWRARRAPSA